MHPVTALISTVCLVCALPAMSAADGAPVHGITFYVSKLGNGKDGANWQNAFRTVQAALDAIPDNGGGNRIFIRPDTYFEANLFPANRGAKGAYNELVGDTDGKLGSGTKGPVIVDSGDTAQKGFKSYDWWGTIRATSQGWSPQHTEKTFSSIGWDRWKFSHLYATGGDAGIFFDGTDHVEPFSVVVEDCVSIGRAFGGGVASCLSRPDEPITYRRCHLIALDFWGDTAGAYVRVENKSMPKQTDAVFEDCILVGPQCALKSSNFGFHTFSNIRLTRCRLFAMNMSQPAGTPTDGIIQSVQEGKLLHVDLEDCTLAGYKVFGCIKNKQTVKDITYTTHGDVKAYIQFQQEMPTGFHRLGAWPIDMLQALAPALPPYKTPYTARETAVKDMCEVTPFVWKGELCLLECIRPTSGGTADQFYLSVKDVETGTELCQCAHGYGLGSALVNGDELLVFASRWEKNGWHDVTMFRSTDLKEWKSKVVIQGENEELFNTSVCRSPRGFVLAYESNDTKYVTFTVKFAQSRDLDKWTKLPDATFGKDRYAACPCIRYAKGHYYLMYLEQRSPRWSFETYIARSSDLKKWELSSANPILRPEGLDEGINASDPDLVEWKGNTYLYYATGDQMTWANVKRAIFPGTLTRFLESWFTNPGIIDEHSGK